MVGIWISSFVTPAVPVNLSDVPTNIVVLGGPEATDRPDFAGPLKWMKGLVLVAFMEFIFHNALEAIWNKAFSHIEYEYITYYIQCLIG